MSDISISRGRVRLENTETRFCRPAGLYSGDGDDDCMSASSRVNGESIKARAKLRRGRLLRLTGVDGLMVTEGFLLSLRMIFNGGTDSGELRSGVSGVSRERRSRS